MEAVEVRAEDIWIAVVGITGAGKSTFICQCTNQQPLIVGHGLESYTKKTAIHTLEHRGRRVQLIDTPGFGDTYRPEDDVFFELAYTLTKAYSLGVRINAILYMHPINDFRMSGSAVRSLKFLKSICGPEAFSSIVLTATHCGRVPSQKRQDRLFELRSKQHFWQDLCQLGSSVVEFHDSRQSALTILDLVVSIDRKHVLKFQRQMVDECLPLRETDAGNSFSAALSAEIMGLERELIDLRKDRQPAVQREQRANDEKIHDDMRKLQDKIASRKESIERMGISAGSLTAEWDRRLINDQRQIAKRIEALDIEIAELQDTTSTVSSKASTEDWISEDETAQRLEAAEQERLELILLEQLQISKHALRNARRTQTTGWIGAVAGVASMGAAIAGAVSPMCCIM